MRTRACLIVLLSLSSTLSSASTIPVKDAQTAIAIARDVCRQKADLSLKWQANLDDTGHVWIATTIQSDGKHMWAVGIPVNTRHPSACWDSLFELLMHPPKSN